MNEHACRLCRAEQNDPWGARASSMTHTHAPGCDKYADALAVVNRATTHPATDYCGDECPTWLHSAAECTCDTGMFCQHGHHIQDPEPCSGCWDPATPHADEGGRADG